MSEEGKTTPAEVSDGKRSRFGKCIQSSAKGALDSLLYRFYHRHFLCVVALFVIPKFAAIFKELGTHLPFLTQCFFYTHTWGIEYVLMLLLVVNLIKERRYGTRGWKKAINLALLPACFVASGFLTIALFLPLIGIIEKVSTK